MSPSLAQIVKRTSRRIVASGELIPKWSTTSAEGTSHDAMTDEWGEGRDRRCPIYAICHERLAAQGVTLPKKPRPETLPHLCVPEVRRPGEGEKNHFLAGYRADVVVHGHDLDASDLLDHRLHD